MSASWPAPICRPNHSPPSPSTPIERAYAQFLADGKTPTIIDRGANIGCANIWFALKCPRAIDTPGWVGYAGNKMYYAQNLQTQSISTVRVATP